MSFDEVVIPALNNKKTNNLSSQININSSNEYNDTIKLEDVDDYSSPLLEELSKEQIQTYELFLKHMDEEGLQKLLSKRIGYKEEGMDILINELPNILNNPSSNELKALVNLILKTVIIFLEEKHPITIIKALDIIWSLLDYIKENHAKLNIGFTLSDRLLIIIKKRIADTNIKVRNKTIELYCFLLTLSFCDYNNLINELLDNDIKYADVNPLSTLQILSKLAIIDRILSDFNNAFKNRLTDLEVFPYSPVTQFLKMNLSNNKSDIRKKSRKLIGKYIRQFGLNKIALELLTINSKDLMNLQEEIPELRTFIEAHNNNTQLNNSQSSNNNESNKSKSRSKSPVGKKEKCRFCKGLIARAIKKHQQDDCLMFTQCVKCEEMIEVKKLTFHCLTECNYNIDFYQCKRCKEAILLDEYEQHKQANQCNPSKDLNVYNRCPLCHKDIPPTDKGFHTHLVVEGCLKNIKN